MTKDPYIGDDEFVGFFSTPEMKELVQMYALAKNTSISQAVRTALRKWIEDEKITRVKLIRGIVGRIKADWELRSLQKLGIETSLHLNSRNFSPKTSKKGFGNNSLN